MVVEAPRKRGRPKKIQVEVIKVPKQRGSPRKIAEGEISQFKESSLPKNGERHHESKIA